MRIKVGITVGDPSGIGPIIIKQALSQIRAICQPVIIGEINPSLTLKKRAAKAAISYLDDAIGQLKDERIHCLVTCPVSKKTINDAGISFIGHTEYIARAFRVKDYAMMLLNSRLKFVLATRHIPLAAVSRSLNQEGLSKSILLTHKSLKNLFGISSPRIVVCGLNPHASDQGLIGNEEQEKIYPVLKRLNPCLKPKIFGPLPADTAIEMLYQGLFDCAICLYHDQALIALKLTDFDSGVNLTLGLPFIRTSPLHGTAFDLVKQKAKANSKPLLQAVKISIQCLKKQLSASDRTS